MQTVIGSLLCGRLRAPLYKLWIKAAALCERNRKGRPVAVDDIRHKQQRNVVRLLFHIGFLHLSDRFCAKHGQRGACFINFLFSDSKFHRGTRQHRFILEKAVRKLHELSDFFLE